MNFRFKESPEEGKICLDNKIFCKGFIPCCLFPPVHGLQLPQCWVESGAAAISLLGTDGFRKIPQLQALTLQGYLLQLSVTPRWEQNAHRWQRLAGPWPCWQKLLQPSLSGPCWLMGPRLLVLALLLSPQAARGISCLRSPDIAPSVKRVQEGWRSQALPTSLFSLPVLVSGNQEPWHDTCPLALVPSGEGTASHRPFPPHMEEMKLWCTELP